MGQLTRTEIIEQGQYDAGVKGKETRLLESLVLWEQSQYKAWPFGYLRKSKSSLALAAGTAALSVGAGEGGITNMIQRILNPIWITTSNFSTRTKALIQNLDNENVDWDERTADPATTRGIPQSFKVRHVLSTVSPYRDALSLIPIPVPDKAYLLAFDYIELPVTAQTGTGTGIPLYTNDQTMKKFVEMTALRLVNGASDPDYQACRDELGSMVTADRLKDGQGHGNNDAIQMDPTTFL